MGKGAYRQGGVLTPHQIVALRCPSCGGGASQPSREMPFGAEFRCDHCGVISVPIIDRALIPLSTLQKQGEKVCIAMRPHCSAGGAIPPRKGTRLSENASIRVATESSQSTINDAIFVGGGRAILRNCTGSTKERSRV